MSAVTPWYDRGGVQLFVGHVLDVLKSLPSDSVQACITSPPYFALRNYSTEPQVWGGASDGCEHEWAEQRRVGITGGDGSRSGLNCKRDEQNRFAPDSKLQASAPGAVQDATCTRCSAWRGELGSEKTPAEFVAHLVEIFGEVKRVLRPDGLCFLNIGDSYAGSGPSGAAYQSDTTKRRVDQATDGNFRISKRLGERGLTYAEKKPVPPEGFRAKSLLLIPERLAIALSDDGWIVRSRICWAKKSSMPESVKDRPTSAWEHIWMLSKSPKYYWDADAVREAAEYGYRSVSGGSMWNRQRLADPRDKRPGGKHAVSGADPDAGRNMRNFWLLSPDAYPQAHFATFPREIPRRCILASTRPGDTVLDPFAGSGTTALVAKNLERRCIGIELNEAYAYLATDRLGQDVLPLFAEQPA